MLVRSALGAQLRRRRVEQRRTLREVSSRARVSLGYLSEVERGQKEASSELLASICDALEVRLSAVLQDTSDELALAELLGEANRAEAVDPTRVCALAARVERAGAELAPPSDSGGHPSPDAEGRSATVTVNCAA